MSVPNVVVGGQVVSFLTVHERNPIPSPALLERRGQAFRRAVLSFAEANDVPVLNFRGKRDKARPGVLADSPWPERKIDQVMPLMRKAATAGRSRVVAIGVPQEYQRVFTGTKDQTHAKRGREPDDRPGRQRPAAAAWTGSSPFSIMTFLLRLRC